MFCTSMSILAINQFVLENQKEYTHVDDGNNIEEKKGQSKLQRQTEYEKKKQHTVMMMIFHLILSGYYNPHLVT